MELYRLTSLPAHQGGLLSYPQASERSETPDIKDRLDNFLSHVHRTARSLGLPTPERHSTVALLTHDPACAPSVTALCWGETGSECFVLSMLPLRDVTGQSWTLPGNPFANPAELRLKPTPGHR